MNEIIIGLSGHIDHGKTSIIKSLSSDFSGSLKEDAERGMTVDLGIAFINEKITLIDVPGHEDFIKNMMSGVHSIDIGMLVIAADDGIMPQTKEHINILSLLNIKKMIVVINKIDLVDLEIIEIVKLEILDLIEKTNISEYDIVETSTIKNIGINNLRKLIESKAKSIIPKFNKGIFRMPIDRLFSIKGFGTVVTGTVLSGQTKIGDELSIQPTNQIIKIRGINSHNKSINKISIGQRAAINIQNLDKNKLKRGFQLGSKNYFEPINSVIAKVEVLDDKNFYLKKNQRLRFHLGTREVMGEVHLFNSKKILSNQKDIVLINFEKPIIGSYKDKFIIRHYSPVYTLGGGEIILSSIEKNYGKMKLSKIDSIVKILNENESIDYFEKIIELKELNPISLKDLSYLVGYDEKILVQKIKLYENIITINSNNKSWVLTKVQMKNIESTIIQFMKDYFANNQYENNINKKIISGKLMINLDFLELSLDNLKNKGLIKKHGSGWSLINFKANLDSNKLEIKNKLIKILNDEIFNTSTIDELLFKCNIKDKKLIVNILKICESDDLIIRINQNIYITKDNMNILKDKLLDFFQNQNSLSVSDFKKIINSSRKYAIPILEYFDKIKFTYRDNNERKLSK